MSSNDQVRIEWYGRCCFLVELNNKKVLFDPYDRYCNVDIGLIDADILISSSSWHDHGHIGASPNAWIYTYPGVEENLGLKITGIEAKENRGSPTVVFNIRFNDFSITNFADLGAERDYDFNKSLTTFQREILNSTNIAFIRPNIVEEQIMTSNTHNENALKYCDPKIIIPEHYFPESFVDDQVPDFKKEIFLKSNLIVEEMIKIFEYPVELINSHQVDVNCNQLSKTRAIWKFLKLHPQVKYLD